MPAGEENTIPHASPPLPDEAAALNADGGTIGKGGPAGAPGERMGADAMKIFVNMPDGPTRDSFITESVKEQLEALGEVRWNGSPKQLTEDELAASLGDAEVCVTGWGSEPFTARVLESAPRLRVIAHTGGTVATLVGDAAYDRGVRVLSGNELYAQSVAEGVIGYILAALRRIPQFAAQVQQDGWPQPGWTNEGLIGQRVGLVGFGAVARYTAKLLRAFDAEILIWADHVTPEEAARYGARKAELEEIFSACKIVSLHLARTPETYHIIGARLLGLLRPDSLLVNTARGAIVDEAVMAAMLREGRFRAVLDVYEQEPLPLSSPLRGLDNALLIPHMGGPTMDRRPYVTRALISALPAALRGEPTWLDISREAMRRMTR